MSNQSQVVFVVAQGECLLTSKRKKLNENSIIPVHDEKRMADLGITEKDVQSLVKQKKVVRTVLDPDGTVEMPARDTNKIVPTIPGADKGPGIIDDGSDLDIVPPPGGPELGAPAGQAPGRWGYDPASLAGLDLVQLNSLVAQVDPQTPAFDTPEEAIAQLSADFAEMQAAARSEGDSSGQVAQG